MSIVYLLQNQHDQYLSKAGEWLEGDAASALYRTEHKDEAINRKVEFTVKNVALRISIVKASLRENGTPELSSIPKNERANDQANVPPSDNHGPLFDNGSTDDTPPEQSSEQNPNTDATADSIVVTNSTDTTENSEASPIDTPKVPQVSTDEPAEQKTEAGIYTAAPQAEPDNNQDQNTESTAVNTDEVREAI
ncbi:MAG: hypothetical protein K6L80_10630 [Agarilytica sp.]